MSPQIPHRDTFPDPVRYALGVLDRASEGQEIPLREIEHALRLTGDVGWKYEMHEPQLMEAM